MDEKPVILLCWGYNRPSWVQFFEELNDHFQFVYLFFLHPDHEDACFTKCRKIYYMQFKSPKHLLKKIKPDKIVFMGLDGLQTIAINIQAKKFKVPTFFMAHGSATLNFEDYQNVVLERRSLLLETFTQKAREWLFTFKFFVRALQWKHITQVPILFRYQFQKLNTHRVLALQRNRTHLRNPDRYIVFSEMDVDFYSEQDHTERAKFIVIGNLEVSSYIRYQQKHGCYDKGYILYIETPISTIENHEFSNLLITEEEHKQLITQLNIYAKKKQLKLYVKLHPYTYTTNYYPQDDNIVYFKDCCKEELILNAKNVIFYNSSLSIPALLYKQCTMFFIGELDGYQQNVLNTGVCKAIDYKEIINGNSELFEFYPSQEQKEAFIRMFVGENIDGKGSERLKNILEANT